MNLKLASLALIASLGTVSAAAASESYFTVGNVIGSGTNVDFDLIRSAGDGMVALYDYTGGVKGELLGMTDLLEGANADVTVTVKPTAAQDVLAEIIVDGQTVAAKAYEVRG